MENVKRGISVKVFESVTLGIPVIVNRNTLNGDFVELYRCGIPTNLNHVDIEDAIQRIKMAKPFNVEVICEKWNWEREGNKLLKIYGGDKL